VLAALSAALPRVRWPVFFVQPKTLLSSSWCSKILDAFKS
jgi:hypothetical protein